jgi:CRISPR-associated protein Csm3
LVGPTRLIIRDAYLTPRSQETLQRLQRERGLPMSEYKTENAIDRITAVANPRPVERTLRGTDFGLDIHMGIVV